MNEHVVLKVPDERGYEADFFAWSAEQARLLRERRFDEIDLENIVEEIDSLGRNLRRQLHSRMAGLIEHLIKLQVSRDFDPRRQWILSVNEQRLRLADLVEENPSLRPELAKAFSKQWVNGAKMAESGLEDYDREMIPPTPSLTVADALDPKFFPDQ